MGLLQSPLALSRYPQKILLSFKRCRQRCITPSKLSSMKWVLLLLLLVACKDSPNPVPPDSPNPADISKINWVRVKGENAVFYSETKEACERDCANNGGESCIEGKHPQSDIGSPKPEETKWVCLSGEDKIWFMYTKEDCLRTCWINGGDSCVERRR